MVRLKCPRCAHTIDAAPGEVAACTHCGYRARAPGPGPRPVPPPYPPPVAAVPPPTPPPRAVEPAFEPLATEPPRAAPEIEAVPPTIPFAFEPVKRPPTRVRLVIALLLNLVLPGAGTLVAGRTAEGWIQLGLLVMGLLTIVYLVGLAIVPAVWVWALVSSIQHLLEDPAQITPFVPQEPS